ncbi:MAG TPA: thermonuclease family protein [Roseiarcus sp.]|jgi:endonuclease YncB( thermonuclease family)|nr:thermonuclease family protein [Roseiarcus sp.]
MDFRSAHRFRERLRFAVKATIMIGVIGAGLGLASFAFGDCGSPAGAVQVVAVDERLDIALADGRLVRLGGLDLPAPGRGDPWVAKRARDFLVARLVGQEVELDLLASGMDRWDRMLADLSAPGAMGAPETAGESIASALLRAGYARVRPEFETRDCAAARLAVEDRARRAGLGVWRDAEYAVIPSFATAALRRRVGQFVVVEGRVRRVGIGRSRIYLDLAPHDGPTIVVVRKLEKALADAGHPVGELAGQTIRARGVLDDRSGPRLEISESAMIEFPRLSDAQEVAKPRP